MPETADLRAKARRTKNHILTRYLNLADRVDTKGEGDLSENEAKRYWEMTMEFARNAVPRTQEVTGEDGEAINFQVIKYADTPLPISTPPISTSDTPSV